MTDGEKLNKYIFESSMNKKEIAELLGVSRNTLYYYLSSEKIKRKTKHEINAKLGIMLFTDTDKKLASYGNPMNIEFFIESPNNFKHIRKGDHVGVMVNKDDHIRFDKIYLIRLVDEDDIIARVGSQTKKELVIFDEHDNLTIIPASKVEGLFIVAYKLMLV